ncbi:response regulator transcription factor, partial [Porphyromonas gingivalis]|uniref:response regulator transcription factor n=1 Tax=Porphyromonas gingivalis TaxID=837 RepID=UPI00352786B9
MISIVLVDDHELYRVGLRAAISQMQGLAEIVGECGSCEELETFLKEQKEPGLIILRPLHGNWPAFYLLIHCIIGSYFVYLSIKNSIIFLPWHTNPR